ncbi:phage tail sheath family protein [Streptomyces violascens]|uniref:phage tail sheath family protein n=1 Tax=Streptomyces violascens TaxID=67381 RepID=UPI0036657E3E
MEAIPDVKIVVLPDLWAVPAAAPGIARAAAAHCAKMGNRMALLHADQGLTARQAAQVPADLGLNDEDAQFTALYYPWVTVPDVDGSIMRSLPPSGGVAGVWSRVDAERGVHTAPANEPLREVISLERELTNGEQESLDSVGVNCLRVVTGSRGRILTRSIQTSNARTLSNTRGWKCINVRRLVNYLSDSIRQSSTWAVSEPNDDRLRASLRHSVTSFLTDQWHQGALLGRTPEEAFYVICDPTNNPPETPAQGQVICDIGVAPVRPAEFITFQVLQTLGQPEN